MLISKNIYNDLINKEAFLFFNKQYFYFIEDRLSFFFNYYLYLQNAVCKKLLQKFIFRKFFASNFVSINLLKFPMYIIFITKLIFLDNLFISFLSKRSNVIFLRYKKQVFNLIKTKSEVVFNPTLKIKNLIYFNLYLNLNNVNSYSCFFKYKNI